MDCLVMGTKYGLSCVHGALINPPSFFCLLIEMQNFVFRFPYTILVMAMRYGLPGDPGALSKTQSFFCLP